MFRLRFTTFPFTLVLTLAVLWSSLACVSLCSFESDDHADELSKIEVISDLEADCFVPIDDCCGCPDIPAPAGTIQQRETDDEQTLIAKDIATAVSAGFEPNLIFEDQTRFFLAGSPPQVKAPPLCLRIRALRL